MLYTDWDENEFLLAYLITIRTYGTWLHGDERGAVDRHGQNLYGSPRMRKNEDLQIMMKEAMRGKPFLLNSEQRRAVEFQVRDVCLRREFILRALHVRTN